MIQGKQLNIYSNGAVVASSKSCTLEINADTHEVSLPTDGRARTYIPGRTSWKVDCTWLVRNQTTLRGNILKVGTTVQLTIKTDGTNLLRGTAILKSCKVTANNGNLVQGSFSWQGTGPLI